MSALPRPISTVAKSSRRRPAPSPYNAILAAPLPEQSVNPIASKPLKHQAAALRRLFARLGVAPVVVRNPRDTSTILIGYKRHPRHARRRSRHDHATCHACASETIVRERLYEIVLTAYPDMAGSPLKPSFFAEMGCPNRRFYVCPYWGPLI